MQEKIQELKSYSIPWSEVCAVISEQIKDAIGKNIVCKETIDEISFWGIKFENCRVSVNDIKKICNHFGATQAELLDALPYDGEESVDSFGGSFVNKILSRGLSGMQWDLFYADRDRLILIGCTYFKT